jgi:hypothetical protein
MFHTRRRPLQDSQRATFGAIVSMLLLCTFVSLGLLACGSSSGGAQNPTPTTAPAQVQKCGLVQTNPRGGLIDAANAKQAANCFSQAYQKCQAASIVYISSGVDTITTRTFTIKNSGGHCTISDAVQHQVIPAKPSSPTTYTCTAFTSKPDQLQFSGCGQDGNVTVPLQTTGQ